VIVSAGEHLSFDIRLDALLGICDTQSHTCSQGVVDTLCISDGDCHKSIRVGSSRDTYAGGEQYDNGVPDPTRDLVFKVYLPEPSSIFALASGVGFLGWRHRRRQVQATTGS